MPKVVKENNTLYEGTDEWINKRTGETITADKIIKKVPRNGFEITYLSYFFDLFDQLGGKKYKVLKYILANKSNDNTLIITTRALAEKCGVSHNTVLETLKILRKAQLVSTVTGAIMLNPKLAHRGTDAKEKYLLQKFVAFDDAEVSEKTK